LIALVLSWGVVLPTGSARGEAVDPPVKVLFTPEGGQRQMGWLTGFDGAGFDFRDTQDQTARFTWSQLPADRVVWIHERVLDADDAESWFNLAARMYGRADGDRAGADAARRALRAEPALAEKLDRLRDGESVPYHDPPPPEDDPGDTQTEAPPDPDGPPGGHGGGAQGPIQSGDIQAQFWGELSDEVMRASVEQLKDEAEQAHRTLGLPMSLYEDENFLIYSDLKPAEARRWFGLLGDMYARLLEMFSLPPDRHVFRGKCIIYIFQYEADYHRYWQAIHGFNSRGSAGLCLSKGDGFVIASFFRQRDTLNFAHVLVHETVHGFVHRYRSYPFIPSWINEGIAEYIAHALVDNAGYGQSAWSRQTPDARNVLQRAGGLRGMLDAQPIAGWQYPVAHELVTFMIRQSPKRFQAFIDAIKDGKSWEAALEQDYGLTRFQLVDAFGNSIRIRDLRP
jgi:hypothetical protein